MNMLNTASAKVTQFAANHPVIAEIAKTGAVAFTLALAITGGLRIATIGMRNDDTQYNLGLADGMDLAERRAAGEAARS